MTDPNTIARIEPTLSFAEYLANPAYGSSDVRAMRRGPAAMVPWQRANRDRDTEATELGRAAHALLLTPDQFDRDYIMRPLGMDFRTKDGKAWRDAQLAAGLQILSQDDWVQLQEIQEAFEGKPSFVEFRRAQMVEASLFWTCRESGLASKARPDWFDSDVVYDLKISVIAERDLAGVVYKAHANGWLHQLAHNRAALQACGLEVTKGRLVIIAPKPPQLCRTWMLEVREADLDLLELENESCRVAIAACERAGVWPGTPDEWQVVEVPFSQEFIESDTLGALEVESDDE